MAASPQIAAAFETWKLAELAVHYVEPCPDDLMNSLVGDIRKAYDALQAITPTSAEDVLLKLFPVLVMQFEPSCGAPPLCPVEGEDDRCDYGEGYFARLRDELGSVSPALKSALAEPSPRGRRG